MMEYEDDPSPHAGQESMSPASFSLRREHVAQLRALAQRYGVSQSQLLREALDLAFDHWNSQLSTGGATNGESTIVDDG